VSGSGISWPICKSAPRSRQITIPAPHHSVFYRLDAFPAAQPTTNQEQLVQNYTKILGMLTRRFLHSNTHQAPVTRTHCQKSKQVINVIWHKATLQIVHRIRYVVPMCIGVNATGTLGVAGRAPSNPTNLLFSKDSSTVADHTTKPEKHNRVVPKKS